VYYRYAPAAVRAAIENQQNPEFDASSTASVFAPTPSTNVGGMSGGMGGGMGGGFGGGMGGAGQGAMLQQSFGPTAPSTDVFAKGNAAAAGMGGAAPANPSSEVFTGGNQQFNNQYTASVGNAMGSSDLFVKVCKGVMTGWHPCFLSQLQRCLPERLTEHNTGMKKQCARTTAPCITTGCHQCQFGSGS
jgi:hypothetical protein